MSQPVISVENLSKAYRIGAKEEVPDTLVGAATSVLTAPWKNAKKLHRLASMKQGDEAEDILWALKDVSFEVQEGEVVGIVGRNGAGKSTLLKILSRITEPTGGRAVIRGRVSSLLEVGTGFHPELTGRENIYMNGTILGMTKREIDRKFDEIVDFSGVEKFLDTPTKRYSSGMQVRLAFAVAAHLEPEILIIDEVLAVGDAEFQKKCLGKMRDVAQGGRTVLFVSHNLAAVDQLCSSAFTIKNGSCSDKQSTNDAITKYMKGSQTNGSALSFERSISNSKESILSEFKISTAGETISSIGIGESLTFHLKLDNIQEYSALECSIAINNRMDQRIVLFHTLYHSALNIPKGPSSELRCHVPCLSLNAGAYSIEIGIADKHEGMLERVDNAGWLDVQERDYFGTGYLPNKKQGEYLVPAEWNVCS